MVLKGKNFWLCFRLSFTTVLTLLFFERTASCISKYLQKHTGSRFNLVTANDDEYVLPSVSFGASEMKVRQS